MSDLPVFPVGADGRVRYDSSATADLVGCDRLEGIGRPCWRFARLRAGNGDPHCGRDCPALEVDQIVAFLEALRDTPASPSSKARKKGTIGRPSRSFSPGLSVVPDRHAAIGPGW